MAYDIRLVKLANGDMVLGKWNAEREVLQDPAVLQTLPTAQGGVQMLLLPFGYPFDTEIEGEIDGRHVLYQYKSVPEELKTKYLEAASNLTLATPGSLDLSGLGGKVTDFGKIIK
ncbi:hypothetical protein TDMWS_18190 [Thermodesulfomicrobium sp. WS]|uniref:hypothetical protein n=1 Tax=Thermodesulfomicrobium sp. WS TaxID=3004129 RepID=UPI00248F4CB2|nr:hypothetical protein [Thermodesulfomicrobium sp. WS]BDV01734.1 hypothetical protein TDMWS_18190 [Thermodesulfomicrobium sp. WS]